MHILRFIVLMLLFNSFLTNRTLPEGIFTAKELGLYFSVVLSTFLAIISLLNNTNTSIRFCRQDVYALMLLIVLPWVQWNTHITVNMAYVLHYSCYGLIYLSIRVLIAGMDTFQIYTVVRELLKLTLLFTLLLSILQEVGVLVSMSPSLGVTAMFFNPGPYAIYLSALLCGYVPLTIYRFQKNQRNIAKGAWDLILIFLALFFIISSFSRSAWVGSLGASLTIAIVYFGATLCSIFKQNRWAFIVLFLAALGTAIFAYQEKESSATGRILIWNSSIALFEEHFVSGVGVGMFSGKYIDYQAITLDRYQKAETTTYNQLAGDVRYAFNDIIQLSGEMGIVGLVLFVILVVEAAYTTTRVVRRGQKYTTRTTLTLSVFCIMLCIVLAGMTSYPLQMIPIAILFWLAMAILIGANSKSSRRRGNNYRSKILYGIVLLSIGGIVGYEGYIRASAYHTWSLQKKSSVRSANSLSELHSVLADHPGYLFDLATAFQEEESYVSSIKVIKEATRLSPYPEYHYFLGENLTQVGNLEEALECYTRIERAIPGLYKPRYLKALVYEKMGDTTQFYKYGESVLSFVPKIENAETKQMRTDLQYRLLEHKE